MSRRFTLWFFQLLTWIVFSGVTSFAAPISDVTYLRKLSLHIRGTMPSIDEFSEITHLQSQEEKDAFLAKKLTEYLASKGHEDRMVYRLSERFQIKPPGIGLSRYSEGLKMNQPMGVPPTHDALTDLFARLARENLSWDYLLTGKEYNVFKDYRDTNDSSSYYKGDTEFFRPVASELPPLEPVPLTGEYSTLNDGNLAPATPIRFSSNDQRIAGALTTWRFASRYNTTNVNKNRMRAAAVFRIFLCDPMIPVIPPPPDRKGDALPNAFSDFERLHPKMKENKRGDEFTVTDDRRHGADKLCAACHYKLDPMGRTFLNVGLAMNPEPARGILTFTRGSGELVKRYVTGLGELGQEITKQPEYASCQVEWFWQEFIGKDVILTEKRREELTHQFDQVGRRTNDFIRVLVTSPEFRNPPVKSDTIAFDQVAPLLSRCDSCHAAQGYPPPFSGGRISQETLAKMAFRLSLDEANPHKMPLDWRDWDQKDIDLIKRWLRQGATGPTGTPLIKEGKK